ncbi:MAG TPA: DUF5658 family protein [Planctomycetota bacterium]|nr:DUF5658 family protein [Planctomycetota bacterium]
MSSERHPAMMDLVHERRAGIDRRERATGLFSRHWLVGRRKTGRRDGEAANIYVDRYSAWDWVLVLGVLGLSLLDMVFTLVHLEAGGTEANPVMAWALEWGGHDGFKAVKIATTVIGLLVLLVHVRFRRVRALLTVAFLVYAAVFAFHIYLTWMRMSAHLVS